MKQYDDITFCQTYAGKCGTCLARNTDKKICLGNCEYANTHTDDDFSCEEYTPCRLADKLLVEEEEKRQEEFKRHFED